MRDGLKPLVAPVLLAALFAAVYAVRVHKEMVDFDVYRRAAVRAVHAENLYRADDGHYQFKYLPLFAILARPLAAVQAPAARTGWYALSCALLVILVRWSVRALPERRRRERVLIWLTAIVTLKFFARELLLGQTNVVLAALLTGALLAALVDARRTAGVLVGLGAFVKVYALILVPWLLVAGGLPAVAAAVFVMAAGLLAPALVYGWQGNLDQLAAWYRTVTDTTTLPNLLNAENVSAMSAWTKWTGAGPHVVWLALATIAIAVVLVTFVVSRRKDVTEPLYLEFGLLTLLIPVISPQGWDYVLLVATPAMVCVIDRWSDVSRPWRLTTAIAIALVSFTMYDLIGRAAYRTLMSAGVLTIGTMMLSACLVNLRMKKLA